MNRLPLTRGWLSKLIAATFPGTVLVIGLVGIIGRLGHSEGKPGDLLGQYLMWLGALLWIASFSTCFLWRSAKRAWFFYVLSSLLVWSIFMVTGMFLP